MGYVFIGADGAETRAESLSALIGAIERGALRPDMMMRRDEETSWRRVAEHDDLAAILATHGRRPASSAVTANSGVSNPDTGAIDPVPDAPNTPDRNSVEVGKEVSVALNLGGHRNK